jgi:hypothetical protein
MITERVKIIQEIVSGNSNRLRETFFNKNHRELYDEIQLFCQDISDLPFIQKLWHWVNDINTYFLCKCGNKISFKKNWIDGYRGGCSPKCSQSNSSTKEKRKITSIEKYGVDNVSKNKIIREKTIKTNLEKYGFESSFQNKEVQEKWSNNIKEKYGVDHYFKTDEFKKKCKIYYLQKYGVEHQSNVEEVQRRIQETCIEKYGVNTYLNTQHSRNSVKNYNRSSHEKEICDWLDVLNINYEHSYRKLIAPLLVDIYIPDYKLAIEFNGLYWHSEYSKTKDYHLNKTLLCKDKGIQLIHIWEDDWLNRKDVFKSILLNKLSKIDNRIFARKCKIEELNNETTSLFLNNNHIQGYSNFSNSYGLYYNGELVSLMSFGYRATNGKKEYELIRFCNKLNTSVIGAASKLFSYFIKKNTNIDMIISYADISIFDGDIYTKLGFKYSHRSAINYWWVVKGIRKHRFNYNKSKLVKMGYDPLKTEVEIMHEIGNYRIYGCGQDKYIWTR